MRLWLRFPLRCVLFHARAFNARAHTWCGPGNFGNTIRDSATGNNFLRPFVARIVRVRDFARLHSRHNNAQRLPAFLGARFSFARVEKNAEFFRHATHELYEVSHREGFARCFRASFDVTGLSNPQTLDTAHFELAAVGSAHRAYVRSFFPDNLFITVKRSDFLIIYRPRAPPKASICTIRAMQWYGT